MNEEKEIQSFKNSNLFQEIKTQIKDFVINRLLNKICIQEKKLEIYKKENETLKTNLLYIIKKVLLQQSNEKNFLQSSQLNLKTITINKRSLNNSYFSPIKFTETISDSQSDFNTLNKSRLTRTGSFERKTNELFKNLTIKNSNVEVYNTESGAAFQIYGKKSNSKPVINISNCNIKANGIVSSDLASVTISNTNFTSQHKTRYVVTIESGDVLMDKCKINHDYFFAKYPDTPVIAKNSEFKLNKVSGASRAFFPKESVNCKFINWGGYVLYPDTKITNSIFTRDSDHVVGKYYIGIGSGYNILIEKSSFKRGDDISYNSSGTIHLKECHYINKTGTNVTSVIEEGIIHDDIVS